MTDLDILDRIDAPRDLQPLSTDELDELCAQIRKTLLETVSHTGGHLASNLGVVELTVALHKVFRSPQDKIIFDVGHQVYTHKLLTGRRERFSTLRQEDGLSGFPRPNESEHDIFYSGHSGTSVSAAYGVVRGNQLNDNRSYTVAVVGDGSFTNGLVYEALNNAGRADCRLIVVLNDNEMSISRNVGSLARYLAVIRSKPEYVRFKAGTEAVLNHIPLIGKPLARLIMRWKTRLKNDLYGSNLFEDMGFRYMGPVDGHNLSQLINALETAKLVKKPVLLHVHTVKGKGCEYAEQHPALYHGISKFDVNSGEPLTSGTNFSEQFGKYLCGAALHDRTLCAVTAAMSLGTGLRGFEERYPRRFFDVGIAEEHAVTFASGLSKTGMRPVVALYSTFLQRAYDEILHDGALQDQKMVLAVDRAGFTGEDGETHQGIYDTAFLNSIPQIIVWASASYRELHEHLRRALYIDPGLVAVRYPRGSEPEFPADFEPSFDTFDLYGAEDAPIAVVSYGRVAAYAMQAAAGLPVRVLKLGRIKPIDPQAVDAVLGCEKIFFFEEGVRSGGIGESFALMLLERGFKGTYSLTAAPDCFVPQASVSAQLRRYGLDTQSIRQKITGQEDHHAG
ncbi:MAG: 1-deoxy-D-xylulose-5-phosphate synthase [Clostridia bacterium]|nr:1-deoxy-D-xylulose-5-phosphate synthase [Clostridia bacterium]